MSARTWLVLCCALAGCSHKSSSDGGENGAPILTRDMQVFASVTAEDGSTARIYVSLDDGELFGDEYFLTGGDELEACVLAQCRRLDKDFGQTITGGYGTDLAYVPNQPYVISLSRRVAVNAPATTVTLPPPFEIDAPVNGDPVHDGTQVTIIFSPTWPVATPDDAASVKMSGRCTHTDGAKSLPVTQQRTDLDGDGRVDFNVDELFQYFDFFAKSSAPLRSCDVVFTVTHERRGTVDAAYEDGSVVGTVTRSVTLRYTPSP